MEDDSDGPWYQQIYDRISRTGWLIIVLSGLGIMAVILGILGGKGILSGSGYVAIPKAVRKSTADLFLGALVQIDLVLQALQPRFHQLAPQQQALLVHLPR
jgi:hypothetical protein